MLIAIRKNKFTKAFALFLVINFVIEVAVQNNVFALTGGPSQPEVQSFEPIGTSEMVDLFSGDFNYNIPLMDVGGYPINMSYHSGITMDQEASWVGLGWNINPGVVLRNMRSLPDDFKGEEVTKKLNIKDNNTYGLTAFIEGELFGLNFLKLSFGLGLSYNNYTGVGFEMQLNPSISAGAKNNSELTFGLGLSANSEAGVGVSPSLSFSKKMKDKNNNDVKLNAKVGLSFNSRAGLGTLNISASVQKTFVDKKVVTGKEKGQNKDVTKGFNGGARISFATPTYTPQITMPLVNTSISISATLGLELYGGHPEGRLLGYYSGQYLLDNDKTQSLPAYGYMYAQEGSSLDKVMLDFNREKDGSFTKNTKNLPLTNFTYDIYSVSGQGIGGMYRPFRSDVGILFDSKVTNLSGGVDLPTIEIGAGNAVHPGTNVSLNESDATSGKWDEQNNTQIPLKFTNMDESVYFKQAGEKTAENDMAFFDATDGFNPVRVKVDHGSEYATQSYDLINGNTQTISSSSAKRTKRVRRNEAINILTASEAKSFGDIKDIEMYSLNNFSICTTNCPTPNCTTSSPYKNRYKPTPISRTSSPYQSYHISQISAYRADGARYIYGIPAYNTEQQEVTFATNNTGTCSDGLVDYISGTDDDVDNNDNGLDNYVDKTIMPPFAHSYLLTEILSVDYVDLKGDGPTDDDLGNYTKINYTRTTNNYQWRVPFEKANYNEGLKSNDQDNKANYIYGKKEIWYVHSIETKTHLAEFTLADREDGYGVNGTSGGRGSIPMKKLMKITLYAKQDKIKEAYSGGTYTAIPIKTVHFEYDYSLCKGIKNNSGNSDKDENGNPTNFQNQRGKLTLKKVFFTYGNSKKAQLSPYEFFYADIDHDGNQDNVANPSYNLKAYDRWGNFKPNNVTNCSPTFTAFISTSEFPYVDQSSTADIYAAAWHLTSINLPSGGTIKMDYEADDYAYVQDQRAMQMVTVSGAGNTSSPSSSDLTNNKLYDGSINNYIYFKLESTGETDQSIGKKYFREKDGTIMKNLYFKFLVDVARTSPDINNYSPSYEYVPGYAEINGVEGIGFGVVSNNPAYGWVKLTDGTYGSSKPANPISMSAWNFVKLNLPRVAYDQTDPGNQSVLSILKAMVSTFKQIKILFRGFYNDLKDHEAGKFFIPEKSILRLYCPTNSKKGGGSRVKQLALSDNWNTMADPAYPVAQYGQVYDYKTKDDYGAIISSGVAAYEPILGGDENPFRQPVFTHVEKILVPDEDYYLEKPFGESFFPGAGVGYSKVTVSNLPYTGVKKNATGKVVHEFYTARDFPTITNQTGIDPVPFKYPKILKILKIKSNERMTATQGYVVELNDMHGKPWKQSVYQEDIDESPISSVEYIYKTSSKKHLDNNVSLAYKDGTVGTGMAGVDYDFVVDMRQHKNTTRGGGLGGNLDAFIAAILPIAIPMVLPTYFQEKVQFRSVVATKVINRYGILEKTIAHDLGSQVSTINKLFDAETGEVLLTETVNQFDDPVYSFTYPAHWGYTGMGQAYKNIGLTDPNYFVPGDELAILNPSSGDPDKVWVVEDPNNPNSLITLKRNGDIYSIAGKNVKVLRSGRRNQQNTPIGNITTLKNPIVSSALGFTVDKEVLNASAVEFSDEWGLFCECCIHEGDVYNPFVQGKKGNWRAKRSYLQLTERTQSRLNDNTNVRKDGIFTSFTPFWNPNSGNDWNIDANNWQFTSEVTTFSPYGFELENKDALGRFSSAIYGYNNILPISVASNSQYKEIAFDSFEDYDFDDCPDDHFSFEQGGTRVIINNASVTEDKSHAGKRSMKVGNGGNVETKRIIIPCAGFGIGSLSNMQSSRSIGGQNVIIGANRNFTIQPDTSDVGN